MSLNLLFRYLLCLTTILLIIDFIFSISKGGYAGSIKICELNASIYYILIIALGSLTILVKIFDIIKK